MMLKIDAKFEEKLTCAFKNDKNLLPEHMKVSKMGFRWDAFIQKRKCMNLKLTGIQMGNLTNFDPSIQKSQKSALKSAIFYQSI